MAERGDGARGIRPFWSGTISFGLVSVPVALWPAQRSAGVALRMLAPDGTPLERRFFCPRDEREVPSEQIVRGYALDATKGGKTRYVELSDEELEGLAPERTREIDLRRFVDRASLDPAFFHRAYFLTPAGDSAKAYRLLAAAMEKEGKAGIATFVMRAKEYPVAILAEDGILRAETLRFSAEIRTPKSVGLTTPAKPKPATVQRFRKAIRSLGAEVIDRDELVDRDAERLLAVVEAKLAAGEDVIEPETGGGDADRGGVVVPIGDHVDLMDAIRRSLEGESTVGKRGTAKQGKATRRAAHKKPVTRQQPARKKAGNKAAATKAAGKKATGPRPALAGLSRDELYAHARKADLSGRSKMTKDELVAALAAR